MILLPKADTIEAKMV